MLRGAAKLGLGLGRIGLGAVGAVATPLMIPMAAMSTLELLEKAGMDPTGSKFRGKAPARGAAFEEAILEGIGSAKEGQLGRRGEQLGNAEDELIKMLMRNSQKFAAASRPMPTQDLFDPINLAMRRGLL